MPSSPQAAARIAVEAGVLLDRATLQRLPYVHRIRCDSQGTSRRVLIGTETARGTQWFTPEQCSLGPAGLVTPALKDLPNRPIARPPARPQADTHHQPARISPEVRRLLLRLATARQSRDITNTRKLIKECDGLLTRRTCVPAALKEARDSAEQWLLERSKEVVTWNREGERVVLTGDAAKQETEKRARQARQAAENRKAYLAELKLALEHERFGDVRGLLRAISQLPDSDVPLTRTQIDLLKGARARVYDGGLGKLQDQVARKKWLQRKCPTCNARPGQECFDAIPDGQPLRRMGGHDERLQLVIAS
ncbi:zinc finger domain-containing protein [Streptomyces mirabilis]|uniref:zinc finger domain-containing protein n=1 Tax=Streptomyces mirabilis TaxID=68239 RepID=UPI00367FA8E6